MNIYEHLKNYKSLGRSSFHTPGHKYNFFRNFDFLGIDLTELPLTDSLYESSGIIKEAEEKVSQLYESKASFFSAGGNTLCIQAMIKLACGYGGKILCDRVVHRSAVSAMALLGVEPIWVRRNIDKISGIATNIDIEDLKLKLEKNPEATALYITSPSYHGVLQDISSISEICKKYGVAVLVDNAHGAHLKFLGVHPLDQGASLVADSAHKTLPVLTGGAWLHVNDDKFKDKAKSAMALFGSTSPMYPIMASLDLAREWLSENGFEEYNCLKLQVNKIKEVAKNKGIYLLSDKVTCDPTRITLGVFKIGYSGPEFREELYKFKIEPEFCDENYVVLIPTPFNLPLDWNRLKTAIESIKPKFPQRSRVCENIPFPDVDQPLYQAIRNPSEKVDIAKSLNKVAAEIICPCPPGIPVVMPGEKIGLMEQRRLKEYGIKEISVVK